MKSIWRTSPVFVVSVAALAVLAAVDSMKTDTAATSISSMSRIVQGSSAPIRVIDGDTVRIGDERIRLLNIDTPEIRGAKCDAERRLALVARRRVEGLVRGARVRIDRSGKDRYGRTLATLYADGRELGATLVSENLARPWRGRREPWCE